MVECGFATEPGQEAAFSDGEVSQMPRAGAAEGVVVVDGPIGISVCRAAELREIVQTIPAADDIAEIGSGLNPACRRNGDFEEEKKARGLVHVAIGDNVFYGGKVESPVHMDMVLYEPTVMLDDRTVVQEGAVRLGSWGEPDRSVAAAWLVGLRGTKARIAYDRGRRPPLRFQAGPWYPDATGSA